MGEPITTLPSDAFTNVFFFIFQGGRVGKPSRTNMAAAMAFWLNHENHSFLPTSTNTKFCQ